MKKSRFFLLFFLGISFVLLNGVYAQELQPRKGGNFNLDISPKSPGPFQSVTASVVSNVFNINDSRITWVLNGNTQLSGVGKKNFTFTTGEVGDRVSLQVIIDTADFGVLQKEFDIRPSDADILWEADTYTPPFYKGKALPSSQSRIKLVGVPNFITQSGKMASDDLIYTWKKGYSVDTSDSGIGKSVFFFKGAYTFNNDTVDVSISTTDNTLSVSKKVSIPIIEPKIVFYERKPLEGIRYENSLGSLFAIQEGEVTLRTEPYFFSFQDPNNNGAVFTWRLDGKKLDINPSKKSEFTLRKPEGGGSGHATITLGVENSGYGLQKTSKDISILYGN